MLSLSGERLTPPLAAGFDGVGLLRPEFILRDIERSLRSPAAQAALHAYLEQTCAASGGKPVWYRLADLWSDERAVLADGDVEIEQNPMLGLRGARPGLADPALLQLELALACDVARRFPALHLLVPFVSDAEDFGAVAAVAAAVGWPNRIGAMIEIPAAVIDAAEIIAAGASNLMFGLNDLTCLLLGRERGPPEMKSHPAVGWCIDRVAAIAAGRCDWGIAGALSADLLADAERRGAGYASIHYADAAALAGIDPALLPERDHVAAVKAKGRAARRALAAR